MNINNTSPCSCGRCSSEIGNRCDRQSRGVNAYRIDTTLAGFPLAMVYSPYQAFEDLYEPEKALCQGTLFAQLDKPFYGSRRTL